MEYDVRFQTNDFGFVDDRDYGTVTSVPASRRHAFVGDSFTAGFHGGTPWVPRLRERAAARGEPIEIYNLGVGGTGFRQFLPLLRHASRELEFDHVVFLFVGDDLTRILWRPVVAKGGVVVCPIGVASSRCARRGAWIRILRDRDAGPETLWKWAENTPGSGGVGVGEWLRRNSQLIYFLARSGERPRVEARKQPVDLRKWLGRLPGVLGSREAVFLHIPEKHEVRRGSYDGDFAEPIRSAGYRYVPLLRECGFRLSHYFAIDPHLNREGYAVLSDCVRRVLDLP